MKTLIQYCFISLFSGFLVACTVTPSANAPLNQQLSWQTRQHQLSSIQSWTLNGQISIQNNQKRESANVTWHQAGQDYTISMFGPLGLGGAILTGKPGLVTLEEDNGQKITANSPEALINKTSHWLLPISNLYFWIRGIPGPTTLPQFRLDSYNHLIQLKQEGWKIRYLQYTGVDGVDLPSIMTLSRPPLFMKLVINQWNLK